MRCAAGVTLVFLALGSSVSAADDAENLTGRVLHLTFDQQKTLVWVSMSRLRG
jgi:hypothetical protein